MAYTKAQLEAIKNSLLKSQQPIPAIKHRQQVQSIIDEMFDAQTRGNLLGGVQVASDNQLDDLFFLIRNGEAYLVPLPVNPLQRVAVSTSANIVFNMSSIPERVFVGSDPIAANKTAGFSNAVNMIRGSAFLELTGNFYLEFASYVNMLSFYEGGNWFNATKRLVFTEAGKYRIEWKADGDVNDGGKVQLDLYGPYTS